MDLDLIKVLIQTYFNAINLREETVELRVVQAG